MDLVVENWHFWNWNAIVVELCLTHKGLVKGMIDVGWIRNYWIKFWPIGGMCLCFYSSLSSFSDLSVWSVTLYAGKNKISGPTIVAIVVPIAASLVLFVIGYCLITKRAKKKYSAVPEPSGKDFNYILWQSKRFLVWLLVSRLGFWGWVFYKLNAFVG
jgi:hypothetical protein